MSDVTDVEIAQWTARALGYRVVEKAVLDARELEKKAFSDAKRQDLADKGQAMSDGTYPIENQTDLNNAVNDYDRTGQDPTVKSHIESVAAKLNLALPSTWTVSKSEDAPSDDAVVEKVEDALPEATDAVIDDDTIAKDATDASTAPVAPVAPPREVDPDRWGASSLPAGHPLATPSTPSNALAPTHPLAVSKSDNEPVVETVDEVVTQ